MNPRTLDEKPPGLSRRWGRPVLGSFALHALLLGAIVLALMQRISPHLFTGSREAVMTLSLQKPLVVSTALPPTPAATVKTQPAAAAQTPAPVIEQGVPILAAQPKRVAAPSPKPIPAPASATVSPTAPVHHSTTAKPAAAAASAHVAPMASSYAPGEDVFAHPPYPEEARERGEIGTVKVNVRFDARGGVAEVAITQSSGSLILDHQTATFIRSNWHSEAEAGQVVSVPVRYTLENL
jgi:protein TonB